jgi:hypothetical protein
MAHGLDQGGDGLKLIIGNVNRAGKEIKVEISPETHDVMMAEADALLDEAKRLAEEVRRFR